MHDGVALSLARSTKWTPITRVSDTQYGFYARPSAHLRSFGQAIAGWWQNFRNSGIARFVQGGVVKTFR